MLRKQELQSNIKKEEEDYRMTVMFSTVNMFVLAGIFVFYGTFALPTQSSDIQKKTVTYVTRGGEVIVEEISVKGDSVEIDTTDITLLSNRVTGLNTLIFKIEEGWRCYVSPRATFPVTIEKELQSDLIEADGISTLELIETGIEVDPDILDEVAYSKCKDIPTFWTLIKKDTKDGNVAVATGHNLGHHLRMRRKAWICFTVCLNGSCYRKCY